MRNNLTPSQRNRIKALMRGTSISTADFQEIDLLSYDDYDTELSQLIMGYSKSPTELIRRAFKFTLLYDVENLPTLMKLFISNKKIFTISTWSDVIDSSIPNDSVFSEFIRIASEEIADNPEINSKTLHWLLMYTLMDITDFEYNKIGHDIVLQHYCTIFDHPNFEVTSVLEICRDNLFVRNSLVTKQNGVVFEAIKASKRKDEIMSGMYALTSSIKYLSTEVIDMFVW